MPVSAAGSFGKLRAAISQWRLCACLLIAGLHPIHAATVSWVGPSGDWSTAANWSTGSLPGASDDVVIPTGTSITVTHSTGADTVNSIDCHQPFTLSGGSLSIGKTFQTDNTLSLSGGALIGATVQENGGSLVVSGQGSLLDGVTVNGTLDVGNSVSTAEVGIADGLTLNGTMLLGNPANSSWGDVNFSGSQVLDGNGTVVFGLSSANGLTMNTTGTTLVIGSGITMHGQAGWIGYDPDSGWGVNGGNVVNQGTISDDVSAGSLAIYGPAFNNEGTLEATNAGQLSVSDLAGDMGQVLLGAGSTVTVGGSYTNNLTLSVPSSAVLNLGGTWANTGTINAAQATLNFDGIWSNIGDIEATGGALTLGGGWTSGGQIQSMGSALTLGPSWTTNVDSGIIEASDGVLNLEGSFTLAMVDELQVSGGEAINLLGTLNNKGTTLVVDGAASPWTLAGGFIIGGTVVTTNGGSLVVSGQGSLLDGVTVNGTLDVGNSVSTAEVGIADGLTLNGTMLLGNPANSGWGDVNFSGNQLLGGNGKVIFGFSPANGLTMNSAGTTLVIGPGITVHGQAGWIGYDPDSGWGVNGGSVVNQGTISDDVSAGSIAIYGPAFNNEGMLEATNGGQLSVSDLAGNVGQVLLGAASAVTVGGAYTNNLSLTVPTNAVLNLAGNWANTGSLNASQGTINFSGTWSNSGNIEATGGVLSLGGGWTSGGHIQAVGGVLALGPSWTTNVTGGVIQASQGALNLEGSFTVPMVEALQVSGGEAINLLGTLNNEGTTLVVDGAVSPWTLAGGFIIGGTVVTTNGAALVVSGQGALLDGVTVNGTLDVGNSVNAAEVGVADGLTLNGTMLLGNPGNYNWGNVNFSGSQVLGGNGTVVFGYHAYNGLTMNSAGTTLVIGPGITVHGQAGYIGYDLDSGWGVTGGSVVNQGTISDDVSTGFFTINVGSLNNEGTLEATNGGELSVSDLAGNVGQLLLGPGSTVTLDGAYTNNLSLTVPTNAVLNLAGNWANTGSLNASQGTINFSGTWSNSGDIEATDGVLSLGGGWTSGGHIQAVGGVLALGPSWTTNVTGGVIQASHGALNLEGSFTLAMVEALQVSGGEAINLLGTLNNKGTTLIVDGAASPWTLAGGFIIGGTVATTNGGSLVVSGQGALLDGVTVNGTLDVGNSVNAAEVGVADGLTLNGTMLLGNPANSSWGDVNFSGSQVLGGNGTVAFGYYAYNGLTMNSAGTTLVIGPGITVHGQTGYIGSDPYSGWGVTGGSVVNQGTISDDVNGGTITINAASLDNEGTLEAQNGGAISPLSTVTTNAGAIVIDSGTMTFASHFIQTGGTLDFGLNSPADFGQVTFSSTATLDGTLAAHLGPFYFPAIGDSFAVLNYGNNNPSFTNFIYPPSYTWTNNATNGVLTLTVQGILPYSVTVSPTNSVIAVGFTLTLAAAATGPGPLTFQWNQNGIELIGATNATLTLTNVSKSATGTYTLTVSNSGASLTSAPVQVVVLTPPALVTPPKSQTASLGNAVELFAAISGDPPLAYQWLVNGANIAGATNSSLLFTDVTRAEAGSYVIVATNPVGVVTSAPPAVLTVTTPVVCAGAPAGMIAWWHGDGDTSDYAGTNDAIFEGTAAYAPGEVGQAFSFDGFSSYLEAPNSPLWDFGTNDFSFEFWANFANTNSSVAAGDGSMALLAHDELTGTRDKWIFGFGAGEIYFYVNGSSVGSHFLAQASFDPQTNQWHHLGLTKASGVLRIYVDGAQVSAQTNNLAVPSANAPLTIGEAEDFFMQGLLDEISIYNRALTSAEIAGIYKAGALGKCQAGQSTPPLTLGAAGFNSSGQIQFQIAGGQVGAIIQVQVSSDLTHWTNIWQSVNTNGVESFTDPDATVGTRRFYRVSSNQ